MAGNTVTVSILSDAKDFGKGLDDAAKKAGGFGGALKVAGVAVAAGVAAAVAGVAAGVASAVKAAKEAQTVYAQTDAVIASTGGAAGRTAEQMEGLAVKLSKLSGIDDVAIRGAENMIATFTNIKGDQFDQTTRAALNMSVALKQDLTQSAMTLGKALNDPIKGVTALRRVGVTFTAEQEAMIKSMVAAGDVAAAQGVILAEVEKEFGGSAEAFGKTLAGAEQRASTAFGRIQVMVGSVFTPILAKAFGAIADKLDALGESEGFKKIIENVSKFVDAMVNGEAPIGTFIKNAIQLVSVVSPIGTVIHAVMQVLPQLGAAFSEAGKAMGTAFGAVMPVLTELGGVIAKTLGGVLVTVVQQGAGLLSQLAGAFASVMPAISTAVQALGGALTQIVPIIGQFAGVFAGVIAAALPAASTLIAQLAGAFTALMPSLASVAQAIGGALAKAMETLAPTVAKVADALGGALGQAAQTLAPVVGKLAEALGGTLAKVLPTIAQLAGTLAQALGGVLAQVLPVIARLAAQLAGVLVKLLPSIAPIAQALGGALAQAVTALAPVLGEIAASIGGALSSALKSLAPVITTVAQMFAKVLEALTPLIPAVMPLVSAALKLIEPLLQLIGPILDPLIKLFAALLDPIMKLVSPLADLLTPAIGFVSSAIGVVVDWIGKAIGFFVKLATGGQNASKAFTDAFSGIGAFFSNLIGGVVNTISGGVNDIIGWFGKLPSRITGAIGGLASSLWNIGRDMIQGLLNGAGSLLSSIGNFFLSKLPGWIVGPFKAAMGIHSPSKVFAQLGAYTVQGLAIGLSDTTAVRAAVASLSDTVGGATIKAPTVVSSARAQAPAETDGRAEAGAGVTQMSASDRMFFRELFREFAGSLTVTDGVIATAATNANARLVRAGAK